MDKVESAEDIVFRRFREALSEIRCPRCGKIEIRVLDYNDLRHTCPRCGADFEFVISVEIMLTRSE